MGVSLVSALPAQAPFLLDSRNTVKSTCHNQGAPSLAVMRYRRTHEERA